MFKIAKDQSLSDLGLGEADPAGIAGAAVGSDALGAKTLQFCT